MSLFIFDVPLSASLKVIFGYFILESLHLFSVVTAHSLLCFITEWCILRNWVGSQYVLKYLFHGRLRRLRRFLASQEIPRVLRKPTIHYSIYKSPPPVLSWVQPSPNPPFHFLKTSLNIILTSTPRSSKWSLSLKFPHRNSVYTSPVPLTCYMSRPSHFLDLATRIIFVDQ